MTHEDLTLIKKLYEKNNQDVALLDYIPKLLEYINDLEVDIYNNSFYIDQYIETLDI